MSCSHLLLFVLSLLFLPSSSTWSRSRGRVFSFDGKYEVTEPNTNENYILYVCQGNNGLSYWTLYLQKDNKLILEGLGNGKLGKVFKSDVWHIDDIKTFDLDERVAKQTKFALQYRDDEFFLQFTRFGGAFQINKVSDEVTDKQCLRPYEDCSTRLCETRWQYRTTYRRYYINLLGCDDKNDDDDYHTKSDDDDDDKDKKCDKNTWNQFNLYGCFYNRYWHSRTWGRLFDFNTIYGGAGFVSQFQTTRNASPSCTSGVVVGVLTEEDKLTVVSVCKESDSGVYFDYYPSGHKSDCSWL